jgi:DnaJ-related protein SCJ1
MHVTFENEADENPDWVAGDLIIEVNEAAPQIGQEGADALERTDGTFFRRKDNNLYWREVLSLREAWMGDWSRNVTHLDGHVVKLGRKRGEVTQHGTVEVVANEGMPIWYEDKQTNEFGNLLVEYYVILPDQMESGMEKEFWALWEKWRQKTSVHLEQDSGRPVRDEL